jgi:hypothetical protein
MLPRIKPILTVGRGAGAFNSYQKVNILFEKGDAFSHKESDTTFSIVMNKLFSVIIDKKWSRTRFTPARRKSSH